MLLGIDLSKSYKDQFVVARVRGKPAFIILEEREQKKQLIGVNLVIRVTR
jgi:hypothetical protein